MTINVVLRFESKPFSKFHECKCRDRAYKWLQWLVYNVIYCAYVMGDYGVAVYYGKLNLF